MVDKKKQKEELRQTLLERRMGISEEVYLRKSTEIVENLTKLPVYKRAKTIHCYISLNSRHEVNTHPLIKQLLGSDKKVVVPVTQFESGLLKHIHLEEFNHLKENKWGVLEPEQRKELPVSQLDLVIVPMVGGDRQKNRIGYGKGFYDRFLAAVNCPTVGLLFEQCLVEQVPVEPFDVPLKILVTETNVY